MKTAKKIFMGSVVALAFVILQLTAGAATFDVYPGTGTYPTIQSAVEAAMFETGSTVINVHAGTYNENIEYGNPWNSATNSLTIQSAGDGTVTINGGISLYYWNNSKVSGLNIVSTGGNSIAVSGCENFTIENNTLSGGYNGISSSGSKNFTVKGNMITGTTGHGIYLSTSESAIVEGNTLLPSSGMGIRLEGCPGLSLVSENVIDGVCVYAIYSISTAGDIIGNTITSNIYAGITAVGSPTSGFEISDNVVYTSNFGIQLSLATGNFTISKNECSGMDYGVSVSGTATFDINENRCIDTVIGIVEWSGLNVTMTNNTLYKNDFGIFVWYGVSGTTVENCIFAKNGMGLMAPNVMSTQVGYNCYYGNSENNYLAADKYNYLSPNDTTDNPEFYSETPGDAGFLYLSCNTPVNEILLGASDGLYMGALPVYGGPCDLSDEDAEDIITKCAIGVDNHGEFVSCVADVADNLIGAGYLQGAGQLVKKAARSSTGKPSTAGPKK